MNALRNGPIFEDLYFFQVDVNACRVNYITQIFDVVHHKWEFVHIQKKSRLLEIIEDLSKLSDMFFPWSTENHDIIEIENDTFNDERS